MNCVSCQTVQSHLHPPGGILYENTGWIVFLRSRPPLVAGQGFIVLKRHCESVAELTLEEQTTLGAAMTKTAPALTLVLKPEKVHFGLYAEGVKHIHLHVTPRLPALPAGNIPLTLLSIWLGFLQQIKLRKPISDDSVLAIAEQLRQAFAQLEG
jgi:diadenosine tetraphosphate (Ap4A) HIT family hydrolase